MHASTSAQAMEISYRAMRPSDLDAAAECFAESFQREPMVRCLGVSVQSFLPFAKLCARQAIAAEMGLVAVDTQRNQVVGFLVLQDCLEGIPEATTSFPLLAPIFSLLGQMQERYIAERKVTSPGRVAVVFVMGVKKPYEGRQITATLFRESLNLAKQKGYSTVITEVTSRASQNLVRKRFGFLEHSSVLYREFMHEGVAVFRGIEDEKLSCLLMERAL